MSAVRRAASWTSEFEAGPRSFDLSQYADIASVLFSLVALRVSMARVLLLIAVAVLLQLDETSTSATMPAGNVFVERVDDSDDSCETFLACLHSLKEAVGGRISFQILHELQSCLELAIVECPNRPSPWFALAAVMGARGNSSASLLLCKAGHRLSEDKLRSSFGGSTRRPFLSIVLAGRADTYRGNPMKQACLGLRSIAMNANAVQIPTEVVFVDYNSPPGGSVVQHLLPCINGVTVQGLHSFVTLRVVVVPLWVLQIPAAITSDGELLAFNEYVAKNVGIRRASGTYVIVSNPEVILPSLLWRQFASNPRLFFRTNLLVSSDRRDSWGNIEPGNASIKELERLVDAGVRVVWSHLQHNGSTLPRATDLGLAPNVYFVALNQALRQCPWQDADVNWQGNGTALAATFSGKPSVNSVHHTAAGDFIMVHRAVWMRVRGYFDVWSFERPPIDSLTIVRMVLGLKMRQMVLRGQYAVWHYSDQPFTAKKADDLLDLGRHRVSDVPATLNFFHFFKWVSYQRGCSLAQVNSCTWGLCSPFSALELPFTTERLFHCGSMSRGESCLRAGAAQELSRMCSTIARFPFRSFDYILMPALQLLDEDASIAAIIVNTGCLIMQRNLCASQKYVTNVSLTTLSSTTCCANLADARQRAATRDDPLAKYFDLEGLVCG